ncbi:hypothetical protein C1637_09820 [Chryseobacterium lactis]|uniref:Uncharacterized protein n=1 Tax=Chryseobacterium lactis TaxID=1241981 RepID=A0A3G6RFE9_CHRLC|nr:hypothetical protein [Chryseobacterium lactis]AZA82192.1 hypothetical protein EG342_09880 [Chryseobacterium lactis]AZB02573.1 hypothetical protein EG341_00735 [Chryseobacterium lactis]PNW14132.1 hypothetical protein C1637_09820 [Chryseobacterium lactis]
MSSHQEKQEIFDAYAKSKNFTDWPSLQHVYKVNLLNKDEFMLHVFAACNLVQEEQQKRIAEKARINFHDGHFKTDKQLKYYQAGADNLTVDKDSILNCENFIK